MIRNLITSTVLASVLVLPSCGRPDFETVETRITAQNRSQGSNGFYSATMKAYFNNIDGTVNIALSDPVPSWIFQCTECEMALMEEAKKTISQMRPDQDWDFNTPLNTQ